ncbi:MAG TPA: hypothetical protein VFR23_04110 [Jiangellaceae bacterium]|nr:hypothetical protein [Jiangellaceae bacterium]
MSERITELVYEVCVTERDRYETRHDGTTFSHFLQLLVYDEAPPREAVRLLRAAADEIEARAERAEALLREARDG